MFLPITTRKLLVSFAVVGMLVSPIHAASPTATSIKPPVPSPAESAVPKLGKQKSLLDVAIQHGHLVGQIVNANGQPLAMTKFRLLARDQALTVESQTDATGGFRVPVTKSGVYAVACEGQTTALRAWNANIAPPKARESLLIVTRPTERGQGQFMANMGNRLTPLLQNPIYIGAAVAAAIAIPVTLEAMDDDEDGS